MGRAADRWYANNITNSTYGNNYGTGFTHQSEWLSGFRTFVGAGYGVINNMLMLPLSGAGYADDVWAAGNAAKGSSTFFQGAKYSPKVMRQMGKADDIYHAFPKSVDGFATKFGQYSTKLGGDGKTYQWLKMPGSYRGKTGIFEYTKDANGLINHRYFKVP